MKLKIYGPVFLLLLALQACKPGAKVAAVKAPAKEEVSAASDEKTVNIQYNYYNAVKEKLLGNLDKASELFSQVLRLDPTNHAAMYELATIYNEKNRYNDALHFAKSAAELNPSNEWYELVLADIYTHTGHPDDALKVYEQLVNMHPDRIDFLFQYADALLYAGKLQEAAKVYDKLEQNIGVSRELTQQKQRIYLKLGKIDKAAEEIEKLISSNPQDADGYSMMIDLYLANDMFDKALSAIKRLEQVDPTNPRVALAMAEYYRSTGDKEKSFEELKKAFASPDLNSDIKLTILTSYLPLVQQNEEMLSQALELSKLLADNHPNEANAHSVYGDFLSVAKKYEESRVQYREGLAIDGKNLQAWTQLLITESQMRDFDAMEKESAQALELYPEQSVFYLFSGIALMQNKKLEEAAKVMLSGSKLVVDNDAQLLQFYSNLGDIYNRQKKYTDSDVYFDKALTVSPDDPTVLNNYAYYLSVRNERLDKADEMSKKSNDISPGQSNYEDTYAWILYKKADYEKARIWIEKALTSGGNSNGTILEHYGDILFRSGKTEEAIQNWQKAKDSGDYSELLLKKLADHKLYE
ncbi:MAG: tetratricopeptide repeat protein [Bacteroidota bacterium]